MKTAALIDGAYFLRCFRSTFPVRNHDDARTVACTAFSLAVEHVRRAKKNESLYRIFFCDRPPLETKMHLPVSRRSTDLSKTPEAKFRKEPHRQVLRQRKLALRPGHLSDPADRELKPEALRILRNGSLSWNSIEDERFQSGVKQKAVDMTIGLDIASLAYKKLVDQIVLAAGDADFVPAAKLARREGIDFILNPMGRSVSSDLFEHIDGLHSVKLSSLAETPLVKASADTADSA